MKIWIYIFFLLSVFSCQNSNEKAKSITENEIAKIKKEYLKTIEIKEYLKYTENLNPNKSNKVPFKNLKFNKVIAYDFDGTEEPFPSFMNGLGVYAPVILRQKSLNQKQVEKLIEFLTETKTYGGTTAMCFIPHLGFGFYENNKIVALCQI